MPKYYITYHFDGQGTTRVEADTKEEAEKKWREGEYDDKDDDSWGQEYCIEEISEL